MYGEKRLPLDITRDGLQIRIEEEGKYWSYHRELEEETVEKKLLIDEDKIFISPVEPLNTPQELTSSLLIEFAEPVVIGPESKEKIYLTFPVEIGVFLPHGSVDEPLDIFTLAKNKYTLYGDLKTGPICKYWKSEVNRKVPDTDKLEEGVLQLYLVNNTERALEAHQTVFNAYGMKIFYSRSLVFMRGRMSIVSEDTSETMITKSPLNENMEAAREIYRSKGPLRGEKFIMEGGI